MKYTDARLLIGNTPLLLWGEYGKASIWVKDEGRNLTSSLKDRSAKRIIEGLMSRGELKPEHVLLDTSSGSYACALSQIGALIGNPVTVVVNKKISKTNLLYLRKIGAEVIEYGNVTGDGMQYCRELVAREPGKYIFTDQLNNPDSVKAHYEGTGPEIQRDMSDVAAIIGSMGSGATLLGVSTYFRDTGHKARIFGAIGTPGDEAKIAGTYREDADYRSPFIEQLMSERLIETIPVSWREAMDNVWKLLPRGIAVGPQGGGVLQAAMRAIDTHDISGNVVVIAGDSLLKNMDRFS